MAGPMPPPVICADVGEFARACEEVRQQVAALNAQQPPDRMPHWVVFGPGTADHPGLFVARLWHALPEPRPTTHLLRAGTLATLRDLLPPGLVRLRRQPGDDTNIIETWF